MSVDSGGTAQQQRHAGRPLEGRYGAMLPAAVLALVPFIITSTAWELFSQGIGKALGTHQEELQLVTSLSTAGYAFGALMGGDIIQRFPQRPLFMLLESFFVVGALVTATAVDVWQLAVGMVVQGLTTGLLLVVALPPVVRRFPAGKMPITSASINMGFFGAITAGPLVGGAVALAHAWRWYFGGLAGLGLLVILVAALSLPDQPPMDPGKPLDWHAVVLGLGATVLPFYAAGVLQSSGFAGYRFTVPLAVGVASFVALILTQYHKDEPLSPVKPMWNTYPIIGTLIAMFGGGLFVSLLDLGLRFLTEVQHAHPLAAGLAFWPLLPGIVVAAVALALLIRTRWLPLFILAGMLCLTAAAWRMTDVSSGAQSIIPGAAVLLGFGAGATVSPGLWLAGFSLPSKVVGRIFALVELVRSVADFILAPVILEIMHMASWSPHPTAAGVARAAWYVLLISGASTALCVALYCMARPWLPKPDLDKWLEKNQPAFHSPQLLGLFRGE